MKDKTPVAPVTTPQVVVEQPKTNNFLVILLSILLTLSVLIAGFFAYQTQKLVKELTMLKIEPTYEPGLEPEPIPVEILTKDWKTYTNKSLGFSLQYPKNLTPIWEFNDQDNRLTSFGTSKTDNQFEVRLIKDTDLNIGIEYGFLGAEIKSTNIKIGGITGFQAISTTGYSDAGNQGMPYVEFATRQKGNVYHLIFYGDATVSIDENQILSTFKFTN